MLSKGLVLLGAGVLGRRIACTFVAAGYSVNIRDPSKDARDGAIEYINSHKDEVSALSKGKRTYGHYAAFEDMESAVRDAWLVIEAVPEKLELKIDTFGELDKKAPADCILSSNSSSFKSRFIIEQVRHQRRSQVLNIHFTMPPTIRTVELIFIFNRLWAAVKGEILTILADEVSEPAEIDKLWDQMFKNRLPPYKLIDQTNLDTVAFIEDNYIEERNLDGSLTVDWPRNNYIKEGRLGSKSIKGGLYPPPPPPACGPSLYFLNVGLGGNCPEVSLASQNGKIICKTPYGTSTTLLTALNCPDGIDIAPSEGRMFWTNMGRHTSTFDGSVLSAKLDGSNVKTLIEPGKVHTPKQLVVDESSLKTGDVNTVDKQDMTRWCVGIGLDKNAGKIYWTQKGPSKGGKRRIFRANIEIPSGETASNRSDIETLFENLPEPIDIKFEPETQTLYWTDRGEYPVGNTLNRANVGSPTTSEKVRKLEMLARHFHEPIGLKLDPRHNHVYVTDLGGTVYRFNLDRTDKTVVHSDDGCYTGITLAF
ncbi:hypothetical protein B7463_g12460, partial [Scytalidium lignicola]